MKTFVTIFIISIFSFINSNAQRYEWASFGEVLSGNSNGSAGGRSITRDSQGNIIIVGDYSETFYSGSDTINAYFPGNGSDVFVAKYTSTGTPLWIRGFGGSWYDLGFAVATDSADNIYVGAYVQTTATDFGDTMVTNTADKQVIKFDPSGNFVWNKYIVGPQHSTVAVHGNNIYFGHDQNSIAKCDPAGNVLWDLVPSVGAGGCYLNNLIAAPNGDVIAIGIAVSVTSFTYDGLTLNIPSGAGDYGYYIRIDSSGTPLQLVGVSLPSYAYYNVIPVAADPAGNVYAGTKFSGTYTFGSTTINAGTSIYGGILKYDNAGNPVWMDSIPSNGVELFALQYKAAGNKVYAGGSYSNAMNLGNGISLPAAFNGDGYILEVDAANGNPVLASNWGQPGASDLVNDFAIDTNGILYGTGLDYGGNPALHCMTYTAKPGSILFAFSEASDSINVNITQNSDTLFANPAGSVYQWLLNGGAIPGATNSNLVITVNGTYTVIATNQYGCSAVDSITIINIGLTEAEISDFGFNIYPNPTKGQITIDNIPYSESTIEMTDEFGRMVIKFNYQNQNSVAIDFSMFPGGIYFVKLISTNHSPVVKKMIVLH